MGVVLMIQDRLQHQLQRFLDIIGVVHQYLDAAGGPDPGPPAQSCGPRLSPAMEIHLITCIIDVVAHLNR